MPWLLASAVLTLVHADGVLSRRQPGDAKHGLGPIVGSMNVSHRAEVSSMPQLPLPPWCFMPLPAPTATAAAVNVPEQPPAAQKSVTARVGVPVAFHFSS